MKTQEGADTINFHDPRSQTGIIRPPATELTADNTDHVVVNVSDGHYWYFRLGYIMQSTRTKVTKNV